MNGTDERAMQTGPAGDSAPQAPRTAQERLAAALPRTALAIDTQEDEPVGITVNGRWHPMRFFEDFSYLESKRFERLQKRGHELASLAGDPDADGFTDEQEEALGAALDDCYGLMVRLILPTLPAHLTEPPHEDEPRRPLSTSERMAIVTAFLSQVAERAARRATAALAARRQPGKRSSRRSAPVTATTATGTRKRRSGASATPTATSPA
jgi:hypothetical protein